MDNRILVRYEPYFQEWISMESDGSLYSVEFEPDYKDEENPNIYRFKPDWNIENACSIPIVVQILLTKRCSYQCPHCPVVDNSQLKNELSTKEVKEIIDYCARNGVLFIRFSGGESTLRPDFPELVRYVKSKGLHCGLLSNCRSYTDEVLEVLPLLSYMQTHLDSVDADTFNKMTGGNNFASFCNTIEKVRKLGVKVNAACTLTKDNLSNIKQIIDFCAHYNLTLKINTIYSDAEGKFQKQEWLDYYNNAIVPFTKEWSALNLYAKDIGCEAYSFADIEPVDDTVKDSISVISPWGRSYVVIDSEGDIYPFSLMLKPEWKLGSIRKGDDMIAVWRNAPFLKILRGYDKKKLGCDMCRMDCVYCNLFFCYSYYGEFGHVLPNNNCPYNKHPINSI